METTVDIGEGAIDWLDVPLGTSLAEWTSHPHRASPRRSTQGEMNRYVAL
jgi:hypothetical protein